MSLRNYILSHSLTMAGLRHSKLKMEVENGDSYELLDAAIPRVDSILGA